MKHLKILGLSLLALVSVMAVSAPAAQAIWVLDGGTQDKEGKLLLNLTGKVLLAELLSEPLGLAIHCEGGTAIAALHTDTAMTKLLGSGTARFTGCEVLDFSEVCAVKSPGGKANEIIASGSGEAKMTGSETYADLSSNSFTEINFSGEECPFIELVTTVRGTVRLTLLNAEASEGTHLATLDDEGLSFFGEKAMLHGELSEAGHDDAVLIHVKHADNGPWAILLSNL